MRAYISRHQAEKYTGHGLKVYNTKVAEAFRHPRTLLSFTFIGNRPRISTNKKKPKASIKLA